MGYVYIQVRLACKGRLSALPVPTYLKYAPFRFSKIRPFDRLSRPYRRSLT